ncbi:hypothetical protein [Gillisia marina]|uniref:hypothetical protein n=1 Tax=Gillisia marina TaxID=1167637 RepID=UPI00029A40F3|nr:hypothetical protein [Gillisia marina]
MERQIKLIWDFRGPEALPIAKHHEIHLKDFIKAEKIKDRDITGFEEINELHSIAFWVVPESEIKTYRDVLKPNRATVYEK